MSHEDEVTTGPFDETDEHDYGDSHHQDDKYDGGDGNGWSHISDKHEGGDGKPEEPQKRNLYVSNLSFEVIASFKFPS